MADALDGGTPDYLILKKKIKMAAEGHGGAWKVAYADFVTAMMAFFLLLWLLNATTEEQMSGLSEYFAPASVADDAQGVGDVMAGLSVAVDGALRSANSRPAVSISIPKYGEEEAGDETGKERDDHELTDVNLGDATDQQEEQELLDEAMTKLRQSITQSAELQELQNSLMIEETPEGLRIQLLDQDKKSMFVDGGANLSPRAKRLLALVGTIIAQLPNSITITGHTDSKKFGTGPTYTNWELSGDRAANTRQWLVNAGLPTDRIIEVSGVADSVPLNAKNPESPKNSRVSIVITRRYSKADFSDDEGAGDDAGDIEDDGPDADFFNSDGPPPLPDE